MAKAAFIGLGVMGYPMAAHLKNKGGHEVTVYNRTAAKAAPKATAAKAADGAAGGAAQHGPHQRGRLGDHAAHI